MSSPYPAYGGPSSSGYLYPPNGNGTTYALNSSSTVDVNSNYNNGLSGGSVNRNKDKGEGDLDPRRISRTPSPTPSEAAELARDSLLDWKTLLSWRFWIRKEWLWYYVGLTIIGVLTALITIYHKQIVHWLTPAANWMHNLPAGWTIPIAILFVISFPPLFGHEIVAILCGVVWGLWIGFAIVAAGTFIGEVGNFYAFKYCCRARGEKLEKTNIQYACLARVVREGGFKIALIARLSAIPGHFTTAIFSTCGMGIITFSLAAILSLPKQFVTVYLGVLLEGAGTETTEQKIISDVVLALTFIITIVAMWYIYRQMGKVRHAVIHDRRKARQNKLEIYGNSAFAASSGTTFNPRGSESDIPLHAPSARTFSADPESQVQHQQWDAHGRAVGYAGDPRAAAPDRIPTFRTEGGGGFGADGRRYERSGAGAGVEEVGVEYPASPRADGRIPVRQMSNDSVTFGHRREPDRAGTGASAQAQVYAPRARTTSPPGLAQSQSQPQSQYASYASPQPFAAAGPATAPYASSAYAPAPVSVSPYMTSSSPVAQFAPAPYAAPAASVPYTPSTAQYAAYPLESVSASASATLPTPPFPQQQHPQQQQQQQQQQQHRPLHQASGNVAGLGAYSAQGQAYSARQYATSPPPPSYTTTGPQ